MKPTQKWLIDVNAYPSAEGWRHPRTHELLKCQPIDMSKINNEKEEVVSKVVQVEPALLEPKKQAAKRTKQSEKELVETTVNDVVSE